MLGASSYHQALRDAANDRPSNVVQEEGRRVGQGLTLDSVATRLEESIQYQQDIYHGLGYTVDTPPPADDYQDPLAPADVVYATFAHELNVSWAAPPAADHVVKSVLTLTPPSGSAFSVTGDPTEVNARNLTGGANYTFSIKLVDRWGRTSQPTSNFTATIPRTAAEEIDLDALALGNRITGLLPNANLAQITDPEKLAEGAVKSIAQAANKNRMPYTESQPAHWDVGAWATVGPGRHDYATGTTMSVVSHGSPARKWWRHTATGTASRGTYVFDGSEYGHTVGEWFILSANVYNPEGVARQAMLGMEFYDAAGNYVNHFQSTDTSIAAGQTSRLFTKYQVPAGAVTARWWVFHSVPAGVTINMDYTDIMLESVASSATGPSPYVVPAMFTGAIGANLIAGLDILGVRAIFDTASIESGKFKSLAADKITSGIITAAEIQLSATGKLKAGAGTTLSSDGLQLAAGITWNTTDLTKDKKVSPPGEWAAVAFIESTHPDDSNRGLIIRCDGDQSAALPLGDRTYGEVRIIATVDGDVLATSSAMVSLWSSVGGTGQVQVRGHMSLQNGLTVGSTGDLLVSRDMTVTRDSMQNGKVRSGHTYELTIANTATQMFNHNYGYTPWQIHLQIWNGSNWFPITHGDNSIQVWANGSQVGVLNNSGTSYYVRLLLFG